MKLTLKNLSLEQGQIKALQSIDPTTRAALLDACHILYLTSYKKDSRDAAKRTKDYLREITLSDTNKLPSDVKPEEKIMESTKKYFAR